MLPFWSIHENSGYVAYAASESDCRDTKWNWLQGCLRACSRSINKESNTVLVRVISGAWGVEMEMMLSLLDRTSITCVSNTHQILTQYLGTSIICVSNTHQILTQYFRSSRVRSSCVDSSLQLRIFHMQMLNWSGSLHTCQTRHPPIPGHRRLPQTPW